MPIVVNNWIIRYGWMGAPFCYRAVHAHSGSVIDFTRAATAVSYCSHWSF